MVEDLHLSQVAEYQSINTANIRSREAALIIQILMSAHIHLTPFASIKMDFQPPASCTVGCTGNKPSLLEMTFVTMKLMQWRGSLISTVSLALASFEGWDLSDPRRTRAPSGLGRPW